MKKYSQRGFTLIELLVVIAIIGLLSSIVLAAMSSARNKGKDAAVKTQLIAARSQSELFFANNSNTYGTVSVGTISCPSTPTAGSLFNDTNIHKILDAAGVSAGGTDMSKGFCASLSGSYNTTGNAVSWATAMPLATDPKKADCIDYTGTFKSYISGSNIVVADVFTAASIAGTGPAACK